MKSGCCGFELAGADWGFLDGQESADTCRHVTGERRCELCGRNWYREGNKSTHDYEESFDGHISGGASFEDCPECVAELAVETAGTRAFAAAVDIVTGGGQ